MARQQPGQVRLRLFAVAVGPDYPTPLEPSYATDAAVVHVRLVGVQGNIVPPSNPVVSWWNVGVNPGEQFPRVCPDCLVIRSDERLRGLAPRKETW